MKQEHETTNDSQHEQIGRKIGKSQIGINRVIKDLVNETPAPKFTVRGEHNVWHVYRNEERLEPPFRNEQRANTEREHYERSHAIRNERK